MEKTLYKISVGGKGNEFAVSPGIDSAEKLSAESGLKTLGGGDDQAGPPGGETKRWGLGVSEKREREGGA